MSKDAFKEELEESKKDYFDDIIFVGASSPLNPQTTKYGDTRDLLPTYLGQSMAPLLTCSLLAIPLQVQYIALRIGRVLVARRNGPVLPS